jgi:hypothetical protein
MSWIVAKTKDKDEIIESFKILTKNLIFFYKSNKIKVEINYNRKMGDPKINIITDFEKY